MTNIRIFICKHAIKCSTIVSSYSDEKDKIFKFIDNKSFKSLLKSLRSAFSECLLTFWRLTVENLIIFYLRAVTVQ